MVTITTPAAIHANTSAQNERQGSCNKPSSKKDFSEFNSFSFRRQAAIRNGRIPMNGPNEMSTAFVYPRPSKKGQT